MVIVRKGRGIVKYARLTSSSCLGQFRPLLLVPQCQCLCLTLIYIANPILSFFFSQACCIEQQENMPVKTLLGRESLIINQNKLFILSVVQPQQVITLSTLLPIIKTLGSSFQPLIRDIIQPKVRHDQANRYGSVNCILNCKKMLKIAFLPHIGAV